MTELQTIAVAARDAQRTLALCTDAEKRDAIVHESRGVTRDRSYHTTDWNGREFVLIDTGGIESLKSKDTFAPRIREQALAACDEADVIVFVVDGTVGVTDGGQSFGSLNSGEMVMEENGQEGCMSEEAEAAYLEAMEIEAAAADLEDRVNQSTASDTETEGGNPYEE